MGGSRSVGVYFVPPARVLLSMLPEHIFMTALWQSASAGALTTPGPDRIGKQGDVTRNEHAIEPNKAGKWHILSLLSLDCQSEPWILK